MWSELFICTYLEKDSRGLWARDLRSGPKLMKTSTPNQKSKIHMGRKRPEGDRYGPRMLAAALVLTRVRHVIIYESDRSFVSRGWSAVASRAATPTWWNWLFMCSKRLTHHLIIVLGVALNESSFPWAIRSSIW